MNVAHEIADRTGFRRRLILALPEIQQGVGGAAVTHLVVEAHEHNVVAGSVGKELRHHEQRDAFDARAAIGCLGQHEMHDVLGQFVVAAGDPHLGAGDAIAAVVDGHRLGGDVGER